MFSNKALVVVLVPLFLFLFSASGFAQTETSTEKNLYRVSQAALIGGLAWDMKTTVEAIKNPSRVSYRLCQDNGCFNVQAEREFVETGWPRIFGERNSAAVVGASVALDAGVLFLSRALYDKGGWRRKVGIGLNFTVAGSHVVSAILNSQKRESVEHDLRSSVPIGAFNIRW